MCKNETGPLEQCLFLVSSSLKNKTDFEHNSFFMSSSLKNEIDSSIVSSLEPSFHLPISLNPLSSYVSSETFLGSNRDFSWMMNRVGRRNEANLFTLCWSYST